MLGVNIFVFVLVLMFLVLVHEAGHMVAAKWCGMRVERFSIFFGRPVVKFTRGETEYGIGWLPLGGYVRISGMSRDEELAPELVPRAYYAAKTWKKIVVIAAGPAVNLVVAFLCFVLFFWIGVPGFGGIGVQDVKPGAPAASIGMVAGDRIVSVNGISATRESTALDALNAVRSNPGQPVVVRFVHGDSPTVITRRVVPTPTEVGGEGRALLGAALAFVACH